MTGLPRPRIKPWVVLAILLAIYIVNFADRYLLTGLIGPIKAEFGVSDTVIGLLMGPAFVVLYVVTGVPLARMADRGSRIHIIAGGCVVWSVATIATGLATGPVTLALSRVAVGIGEAAFVAPAYSLVSDYFRPDKRGAAFAILGLATYIGQILGQAGGPFVADVYDWRFSFWSMGAIGIVLAVIASATIEDPARKSPGTVVPHVPFRYLVKLLLKSRCMVFITGAMTCGVLSGVSFAYWAPEYLARNFHIDPVTVKATFAIYFGLSGMAGMLAFGLVSDRMTRRNVAWPARLTAIALASATAMILMVTWAPDFTVVTLLAIPSGLLGGGWSVGMLATLQYLLPVRIRASGTSLFVAVSALIAQVAGPFAVGLFSDALGGGGDALRLALTLVIPFGFVGAVLAWLGARHLIKDQQAFEREFA